MSEFDFARATARLPIWLLGLALLGAGYALFGYGLTAATSFLLGSVAAYVNLKLIERTARKVTTINPEATPETGKRDARRLFIQFTGLVLGVFAIIQLSGFSKPAAFIGFLLCPAAVLLEIVYELFTFKR